MQLSYNMVQVVPLLLSLFYLPNGWLLKRLQYFRVTRTLFQVPRDPVVPSQVRWCVRHRYVGAVVGSNHLLRFGPTRSLFQVSDLFGVFVTSLECLKDGHAPALLEAHRRPRPSPLDRGSWFVRPTEKGRCGCGLLHGPCGLKWITQFYRIWMKLNGLQMSTIFSWAHQTWCLVKVFLNPKKKCLILFDATPDQIPNSTGFGFNSTSLGTRPHIEPWSLAPARPPIRQEIVIVWESVLSKNCSDWVKGQFLGSL